MLMKRHSPLQPARAKRAMLVRDTHLAHTPAGLLSCEYVRERIPASRVREGILAPAAALVLLSLPCPPLLRAQEPDGPRIFAKDRNLDLGVIADGDIVDAVFKIENRGNRDLILEKAEADCGCTVIDLNEKNRVIPPGESRDLTVQYNSFNRARTVPQTRVLMLFSNDPIFPQYSMEFRVVVQSAFQLVPAESLTLRTLFRGTQATGTIKVFPGTMGEEPQLVGIALPPGAPIESHVQALSGKSEAMLEIGFSARKDAPSGWFETKVTIEVKVAGEHYSRSVMVAGVIEGELDVQPPQLIPGRRPLRPGEALPPIKVYSVDHSPFMLIGLEPPPGLTLEMIPTSGEASEFNITLHVTRDAKRGAYGGILRILTGSPDQPVFEIPLFYHVEWPVRIEPPIILLMMEGTSMEAQRQVHLLSSDLGQPLEVKAVHCNLEDILVRPADEGPIDRPKNQQRVEVRLISDASRSNSAAASEGSDQSTPLKAPRDSAKPMDQPDGWLEVELLQPEPLRLKIPVVILDKGTMAAIAAGEAPWRNLRPHIENVAPEAAGDGKAGSDN